MGGQIAKPRVARAIVITVRRFAPPPLTQKHSETARTTRRTCSRLLVPGWKAARRVAKGFYQKKKARAPCGTRAKFGVGRSPRALSHLHLFGALAGWRAKCFPTLLIAASDALGLIAGPSKPFQAQDLSSEASTPGSVTICRWFARRTGAGTPVRTFRTGTLTTGSATALGGALAPCDGSDLLPLRLLSTYSWVTRFSRRPKLGRLAGVAIPRRSTPRSVLCALSRLRPAEPCGRVFTPPEQTAASWSCSSSRNPLGNCISDRPETDLPPDSARTRFLTFAPRRSVPLVAVSLAAFTAWDWIGCDTVQRNWWHMPTRSGVLRGGVDRTSCGQPFPGCPGLSQSRLRRVFHAAALLDCSIKEREGKCDRTHGKSTFSYHQVFHRWRRWI